MAEARQRRGHKAVIKGLGFEKKLGEYLSEQGYKISYEKPIGKDKFDVFGLKEDFIMGNEYCIVECKDKLRVTATDVLHFMSKLNKFCQRLQGYGLVGKPTIKAILAYTGELPKDAEEAVRDFKPSIKFKKF
jgi:hypothetical protein